MKHIWLAVIALAMASCGSESADKQDDKPTTPADSTQSQDTVTVEVLVPQRPELNEIARVISGLPVDSVSAYYGITQTEGWRTYHTDITKKYRELDSLRFDSMEQWKATELPASILGNRPLLYPFSGPDFLMADIFFPKADSMYLFGLERIGTMPDPRTMKTEELEVYYNGMVRSAADLLRLSFFRTNWMKNDMKANGVVPVMCNFIVRRGHTISNIQGMMADSATGLLKPIGDLDSSHRIARIEFIDGQSGKLRQVTYFQGDISDAGLKKMPGVARFLENLPQMNTYMKAASYLCYHEEFFGVADLFVRKSQLVLQEDTGLPFRHFSNGAWDIQLYGVYAYPVSLFTDKRYRQNDELKLAYQKDSAKVKPLPFPLGYHALKRTDNLMRAVRK